LFCEYSFKIFLAISRFHAVADSGDKRDCTNNGNYSIAFVHRAKGNHFKPLAKIFPNMTILIEI